MIFHQTRLTKFLKMPSIYAQLNVQHFGFINIGKDRFHRDLQNLKGGGRAQYGRPRHPLLQLNI